LAKYLNRPEIIAGKCDGFDSFRAVAATASIPSAAVYNACTRWNKGIQLQ
jgi:hypothetical protein